MKLKKDLNCWATAYVRWQPVQLFMCFVIFVSCGNYIASTYFRSDCTLTENLNGDIDCDDGKYHGGKQATAIIEVFVVVCFIFDYVASAFYYPSFLEYSSSIYGMVDIVVILPSNTCSAADTYTDLYKASRPVFCSLQYFISFLLETVHSLLS